MRKAQGKHEWIIRRRSERVCHTESRGGAPFLWEPDPLAGDWSIGHVSPSENFSPPAIPKMGRTAGLSSPTSGHLEGNGESATDN
jgi:hypothetical protein